MNYWKEKEENNCKIFATGNTKQEFEVYPLLLPKVRKMIEIISRRYFSVPNHYQKDLEDECINEVFIKLKKYDHTKSSFSFVSLVIKRFYYVQLVGFNKTYNSKIMSEHKLSYIEDINEESEKIEYNDSHYERDEKIKVILDYTKKQKEFYIKNEVFIIKGERVNYSNLINKKHTNLVKIFNLLIEYIEKYNDVDFINITEYIRNNSDIEIKRLDGYYRIIYGTTGLSSRKSVREMEVDYESVIDYDFCIKNLNDIHNSLRKINKLKQNSNGYTYY